MIETSLIELEEVGVSILGVQVLLDEKSCSFFTRVHVLGWLLP